MFVAGDIDYLIFQKLVSRTVLITDDDALAAVDAELSLAVRRWPSLSRGQLAGRVDRIVARHDRDAVRRRKKKSDDRAIDIWDSGDGLSEIRGFLRCMDGRALDERLDALAATVCPNDPRTQPQRRADAIGCIGSRCRPHGLRMRQSRLHCESKAVGQSRRHSRDRRPSHHRRGERRPGVHHRSRRADSARTRLGAGEVGEAGAACPSR